MPGIAPEWSAADYDEDEDEQLVRDFGAEAVEHARQLLQDANYQPSTPEERALHERLRSPAS